MTQNQSIQQTIESMNNKHEQILTRINILEQENSEYKQKVIALENKIDLMEKNNCTTTLEIRNVPKQKEEDKVALIAIMKTLSMSVGDDKPIGENEFRDIHRNRLGTIVVNFTSNLRKENLFTHYRNFNKQKRDSKEPGLNTSHLNLPGPTHQIYISEALTSKTRRLFYLARESVKNNKLAAAWTSYGKLYVKKEQGSTPYRITQDEQLENLL